MIKLIKIELKKIFKKKILYILLAIIAIVVIVNTIIGTSIYGGTMVDHTQEARTEKKIEYENKLKELNYNNENEIDEYINTKSQLDLINLQETYEYGSWQEQSISKYSESILQILNEINLYTYKLDDSEKLEDINKKHTNLLKILDKENFSQFIKLEIENTKKIIADLEAQKKETQDEEQISSINNQIEQNNFELEFLQLRLDKNISYAKNDKNNLLQDYKNAKQALESYPENIQDYKQKLQYNKALEEMKELEYKVYNDIPILPSDNARDMLINSVDFYEILIIMVIIIIAASILSEEFNKGTIKLLLVKPHQRWKLLLAKLLSTIIVLVMTIIYILILQTIVGGFVYSFTDYGVPIIQYDFNLKEICSINGFSYFFILLLAKIPMYLLVLLLTFCISTFSCNTAISIVLGMLLYLSKNIINLSDNLQFTKFLLPTNWDFTRYLFGNLPEVSFLNLNFSVMICILSFILITIVTFIYFNKKDIKNI